MLKRRVLVQISPYHEAKMTMDKIRMSESTSQKRLRTRYIRGIHASLARTTGYTTSIKFESLRGQLPVNHDITYIGRQKSTIPRKSQPYLGSTSNCLCKTTIKQERSLQISSTPLLMIIAMISCSLGNGALLKICRVHV